MLPYTWHLSWASQTMVASQLETRQRYVSSRFHTFPWPMSPSHEAVQSVREAALALLSLRTAKCRELQVGLTELCNQVEEGAHLDLISAHELLDAVVAASYGRPVTAWPDFRERLYDLNQSIAADPSAYSPFGHASHEPVPTLF